MVDEGEFPPSVPIASRRIGYPQHKVYAWYAERLEPVVSSGDMPEFIHRDIVAGQYCITSQSLAVT